MEKEKLIIPVHRLTIFMTLSFLFFGLFKEYSACIFAGICGFWLLYFCKKEYEIKISFDLKSISVYCLGAGYLLTCFYGIDQGMSLIGFLQFLGVIFFLGCLNYIKVEEKQMLFQMIPWIGSFMTGIGILAWFIPGWKDFFFVADRLGGFFQYPNVFALFCLVGIILTMKSFNKSVLISIPLLIIGIFLSGSRTVFFLLILSVLTMAFHYKQYRKRVLISTVVILALAVGYAVISGNTQSIGRFLTSSLNSSTLVGRWIYWQDGIQEIIRHPLGLGYLGYFFREPKIQTALYSVRFIHNDYLQLALDTGIIPALLFLAACVKILLSRTLSFEKKLAVAVMCLHFCMDFDLEFTSIWFLFLVLSEEDEQPHMKEISLRIQEKFGKWVSKNSVKIRKLVFFFGITIASAISLYAGIGMLPRYLGYSELSARLLPFYTESNVDLLTQETDSMDALILANKILKQNSYIASAYEVEAVVAYQTGAYEDMINWKEKSLSLQKYNTKAYDNYLSLLSRAVTTAARNNDKESSVLLLEAALKVQDFLDETEENTNLLAYKTRDIPEFSLSESSMEFLEQAKTLLEDQ